MRLILLRKGAKNLKIGQRVQQVYSRLIQAMMGAVNVNHVRQIRYSLNREINMAPQVGHTGMELYGDKDLIQIVHVIQKS